MARARKARSRPAVNIVTVFDGRYQAMGQYDLSEAQIQVGRARRERTPHASCYISSSGGKDSPCGEREGDTFSHTASQISSGEPPSLARTQPFGSATPHSDKYCRPACGSARQVRATISSLPAGASVGLWWWGRPVATWFRVVLTEPLPGQCRQDPEQGALRLALARRLVQDSEEVIPVTALLFSVDSYRHHRPSRLCQEAALASHHLPAEA